MIITIFSVMLLFLDSSSTLRCRSDSGSSRFMEKAIAQLCGEGCEMHLFTRSEARECLRGRWLAFAGDSQTRGLALAALQFLSTTIAERPQFGLHWWGVEWGGVLAPTRLREGVWSFDDAWRQRTTWGRVEAPYSARKSTYLDKCFHNTTFDDEQMRDGGTLLTFCMSHDDSSVLEQTKDTLAVQLNRFADVAVVNTGAWEHDATVSRTEASAVFRSLQTFALRTIWTSTHGNNVASLNLTRHARRFFGESDFVQLENERRTIVHHRVGLHVSNVVNILNFQRVLNRVCAAPVAVPSRQIEFSPACFDDWNPQNFGYMHNWAYYCAFNVTALAARADGARKAKC
eukprot:TRINITY_DN6825_c0_g1_i1.p1 TRINITY_DN6825_c0_g1~~TRINITY_DN6825_c0_g1_i1.p1  ORF type:complete len:344 (-),score=68.29 TRINITY_DN6825_c0_g1_i1:3-1034(-)